MRKRLILLFFFCILILSASASALQTIPDSAAYGNVLFCDDFESYAEGTDVVTARYSPAYVSEAFTSAYDSVNYAPAGFAYGIIADGDKCLKIGKKNTSQKWPQIALNFTNPLSDGIYTLAYKAYLPQEPGGVSNALIRFNFKKTDGTASLLDFRTPLVKGGTVDHAATMMVGADSFHEYAFITSFLVFCACDETTEDSYMLIDDLVLYGKTDKVIYMLPDGTSFYDFYAAGETVTLADANRFSARIGDGRTAVCLRKDGADYPFGGTYQTAADETSVVFDVICADKTYPVYFDADTRAATFPEMKTVNGGTVTLPTFDDPDFVGWYVPGMPVLSAGEAFVFDLHDLRESLDNDGRLVVKAVFNHSAALRAPCVPSGLATGSGAVTVGELASIALTVRDGVTGENHAFDNAGEAVSFAVSAGLLDEAGQPDDFATVGDAVRVLANALPARFYPTLTGDAFAGSVSESLRPYADKLYRAGIIDGETVLSETLTKDNLGAYLEKLCDKSKRSVTPTRTIYVFGDSLCDPSPSYNSWIEKLRSYLDGNINVVNYAVGGYNTANYVHVGASGYANFTEMLSKVKKGDYVFVALGTNDATLWMWNDHPNLSQGGQRKTYEASRDDYQLYTAAARAADAVPVYIVPTSRNIDAMAGNPYYLAYDNRIVTCMEDANHVYNEFTPIVNFKTVSDPLINEQMTVEERAAFYRDSVHYTDSGADLTARIFRDVVLASDDAGLAALRTHLSCGFDLTDPDESGTSLRFSASPEDGIIVENVSSSPKILTFILTQTDTDGRLSSVRVERDKILSVGETFSIPVLICEDNRLTFDPQNAEEQMPTARLFVFREGFTPVAEPVEIYLTETSIFIDIGGLMP